MKQKWQLPDFLDLEYFFAGDKSLAAKKGEEFLRKRDRKLYLSVIGGEDGDADADVSWLLYRWLQERRRAEHAEQNGHPLFPGRMWYELYGLFWAFLSFIALLAGAGLCFSYLSYSGEQPVNVSLFFFVFVLGQLGLLMLLPITWGLRKIRGLDLRDSLFLALIANALHRLLYRVRKSGFSRMDTSRKQQFAASLAAVQTRGKGYGPLFFWPLFLLFQLSGVAFNLGVIGALLLKVSSADLAFGWQSTIQLSTDFMATCVRGIALPWSWFINGGYPTFTQVEGSRMILKDGFYHLASADLVSWWPFLALSICCYCLLPRLLLFGLAVIARKRSLANVLFGRAEHKQLLYRLLSPELQTATRLVEPASTKKEPRKTILARQQKEDASQAAVKTSAKEAVNGSVVAFVPEELDDDCSRELLAKHCLARFGYGLQECVVIPHYGETKAACTGPLFLLQEAWQPPILEIIRFIKRLREKCGEDSHIIVALIGKPTARTIFTPVVKQDFMVWQQKIDLLSDPYLQLAALVEEV